MPVIYPLVPGNSIVPSLKSRHVVNCSFPFSVNCIKHLHINNIHWHDFTQLWYTVSGTYTQTINGKRILQTPGSLALIHPFTLHLVDASDIDLENTRVISINIYEDLQKKNIMPYHPLAHNCSTFDKTLLSPHIVLSGKDRDLADMLFEDIYSEYSRKLDMNKQSIYNNISKIFELISEKATSEISATKLARALEQLEIIKTATEYINNNAMRELPLSEVSRYSLMSQRSFCDKFKECTGQTFYSFYNNIRLRNVICMIRFSDLPLSDISEICGYYDLSHMRHAIKNATGLSPVELRTHMLLRSRAHGEFLHRKHLESFDWLGIYDSEELSVRHNLAIGKYDPRWKPSW